MYNSYQTLNCKTLIFTVHSKGMKLKKMKKNENVV